MKKFIVLIQIGEKEQAQIKMNLEVAAENEADALKKVENFIFRNFSEEERRTLFFKIEIIPSNPTTIH